MASVSSPVLSLSPHLSAVLGPRISPVVSQRAESTRPISQRPESPRWTEPTAALPVASAQGDHDSFAQLYRQFAAPTYRIAQAVIRDPAQAEEVVQEVFLDLWRHADRFDSARGSLGSYISVLAHAKAVDRVRATHASRARDERYGIKNASRYDQHDPVSEAAIRHDELDRTRSALRRLTRCQREAIQLCYFEHRTFAEAGALLGVSVSAVKSRVRSAVQQLRIVLADSA